MDEENAPKEKIQKIQKNHERARKESELTHTPWLIKTRDKILEIKNKSKGRFQNIDEVILYLAERHEKLLSIENKELGITNLTKQEEYKQSRESLIKSMTKEEKKEFLIKEARIIKGEFEDLK